MAKRNNKVANEGYLTEAPYEKVEEAKANKQLYIDTEIANYHCGNSIPDLLRAILTELVRARIERG